MQPITTKQIAVLTGVSRGTVDRALNGRAGVNSKTREKVLETARQLGYVPNRAGKALSAARRPLDIGLVLNCVDNQFYDDVIFGIESCREAYPDFNISLHYIKLKGYDTQEQLDAINQIKDCVPQILIITPINTPVIAAKIDELCSKGVVVITLNSDILGTQRLAHVGCDFIASGRTAAGILGILTGGEGQVGIVVGSLHMLGHKQRVDGFLAELASKYPRMKSCWVVENNDDDEASGRVVVKSLTEHPQTTAIYFAAAGALGGVTAASDLCGDKLPVIVTCEDMPQITRLVKEGKIKATICQEQFRQGYESIHYAMEFWITGKKPQKDIWLAENQIKIIQNI